MNTDSDLKVWIYMLPSMITRINVPIFFMISGALLLTDKDESYLKIAMKRISRIVVVLLIFTLVLFYIKQGNTFVGFSIIRYLYYVIGEPRTLGGGAYWYLYCYIGLLLLLPIFRKIAKAMTKQDFFLLVIAHFSLCSMLPIINLVLSSNGIERITVSSSFSSSLVITTTKTLFYPLIGYYLDHKFSIERINIKAALLLVISTLIGIFLSCFCTYYEGHGERVFTQNYVELFDYLTTISVFLLIKGFCNKHSNFEKYPRFVSIVTTLGGLTFGIYLIDPILKLLFYQQFCDYLYPHIIKFLISVLWCFSSMLLGGLLTFCLKKIPVVKMLF